MAKWINHVTIATPRNGTTTHAVAPSTGTAVSGTLFTPTAGNFLVVLVEGAVTSSTPSGWTLPAGGSAVNNTGLYLWYRTAAGNDSFTTTHNGSNYPVVFDFYEFPSGTTFLTAVAATGVTSAAAGPALSGLTSTSNLRAAIAGLAVSTGTSANTFTWGTGTELVDTSVVFSTTDGYGYGLAYLEDATTATFSSAATYTGAAPNQERIVFALSVPTTGGATTGTLSASTPTPYTSSVSGTAVNTGSLSASAPKPVTSTTTGSAINNGALTVSLPVLTASESGVSIIQGSLSGSTVQVTSSVAGDSLNAAALSTSLRSPEVTSVISGTQTDVGTLSASTVQLVSSISSANAANLGTLTATLPPTIGSTTGAAVNRGSFSAALPVTAASMSGTQTNSGTLSVSLQKTTSAILDNTMVFGLLSASLVPVAGSLAGVQTNAGTWSASLPVLTSAEAGTVVISGALSALLKPVTGSINAVGASSLKVTTPFVWNGITWVQWETIAL
jgi:hypothetical protein